MNKVYKLVWSKVRHCYVVVSELAKSHGKDKSMRSSIRRGAFLMFLGMLPMEMVSAAIPMANQPIVNGAGLVQVLLLLRWEIIPLASCF